MAGADGPKRRRQMRKNDVTLGVEVDAEIKKRAYAVMEANA